MLQVGAGADGGQQKDDQQMDAKGTVVDEAIQHVMATMYGISSEGTGPTLGPNPRTEVKLDLVPVKALLDTGSPVSIVSLYVFLNATKENQATGQYPVELEEAVQARLLPTTVLLHSYGDG